MPSDALTDESILAILQLDAVAAVAQSGKAGVPTMPASNEGLEVQFFAEAHRYFRGWLDHHAGPKTDAAPVAIVLSRAINQDIAKLGAERIFYFGATIDADHGGAILVANNDLSIVARIPGGTCGDLQALGKELTIAGLEDEAHCVLRGDIGEMVICAKGMNGRQSRLEVAKSSAVRLDSAAFEQAVWQFHRKFTQTSAGILQPWKGKAASRVTVENFEVKTSMMLGFYLTTVVGNDNVTVEDQQSHGRVDIKVSSHAMVEGLGPCAIECKVLRSRRSSGARSVAVPEADMIKHASEGVQQAVEYRQDLGGKLAYLLCFDARAKDEDQPDVTKLAAANDVILRRYYMYSTTSDHRDAAAAANEKGELLAGEPA